MYRPSGLYSRVFQPQTQSPQYQAQAQPDGWGMSYGSSTSSGGVDNSSLASFNSLAKMGARYGPKLYNAYQNWMNPSSNAYAYGVGPDSPYYFGGLGGSTPAEASSLGTAGADTLGWGTAMGGEVGAGASGAGSAWSGPAGALGTLGGTFTNKQLGTYGSGVGSTLGGTAGSIVGGIYGGPWGAAGGGYTGAVAGGVLEKGITDTPERTIPLHLAGLGPIADLFTLGAFS